MKSPRGWDLQGWVNSRCLRCCSGYPLGGSVSLPVNSPAAKPITAKKIFSRVWLSSLSDVNSMADTTVTVTKSRALVEKRPNPFVFVTKKPIKATNPKSETDNKSHASNLMPLRVFVCEDQNKKQASVLRACCS